MPTWTELALDCAAVARKGLRLTAGDSPVAVVLGSGLGTFADALRDARAMPFAALPGFPPATVQGHKGQLVYGTLALAPSWPCRAACTGTKATTRRPWRFRPA